MRLDNLVTPTQKQTSKIDEGLRPGDLEHLILPNVSVDEFEPKSGQPDNVVVVGFASSVTSLLEEQAINTNASIRMLIFFILLY